MFRQREMRLCTGDAIMYGRRDYVRETRLCTGYGRRDYVRETRLYTGDAIIYGRRDYVRETRLCMGDAIMYRRRDYVRETRHDVTQLASNFPRLASSPSACSGANNY